MRWCIFVTLLAVAAGDRQDVAQNVELHITGTGAMLNGHKQRKEVQHHEESAMFSQDGDAHSNATLVGGNAVCCLRGHSSDDTSEGSLGVSDVALYTEGGSSSSFSNLVQACKLIIMPRPSCVGKDEWAAAERQVCEKTCRDDFKLQPRYWAFVYDQWKAKLAKEVVAKVVNLHKTWKKAVGTGAIPKAYSMEDLSKYAAAMIVNYEAENKPSVDSIRQAFQAAQTEKKDADGNVIALTNTISDLTASITKSNYLQKSAVNVQAEETAMKNDLTKLTQGYAAQGIVDKLKADTDDIEAYLKTVMTDLPATIIQLNIDLAKAKTSLTAAERRKKDAQKALTDKDKALQDQTQVYEKERDPHKQRQLDTAWFVSPEAIIARKVEWSMRKTEKAIELRKSDPRVSDVTRLNRETAIPSSCVLRTAITGTVNRIDDFAGLDQADRDDQDILAAECCCGVRAQVAIRTPEKIFIDWAACLTQNPASSGYSKAVFGNCDMMTMQMPAKCDKCYEKACTWGVGNKKKDYCVVDTDAQVTEIVTLKDKLVGDIDAVRELQLKTSQPIQSVGSPQQDNDEAVD